MYVRQAQRTAMFNQTKTQNENQIQPSGMAIHGTIYWVRLSGSDGQIDYAKAKKLNNHG